MKDIQLLNFPQTIQEYFRAGIPVLCIQTQDTSRVLNAGATIEGFGYVVWGVGRPLEAEPPVPSLPVVQQWAQWPDALAKASAQEGAWAKKMLIMLTGAPVQEAWMADVAESMAERLKWAGDRAPVLVLLLTRDTPCAELRRVAPTLTITPPNFVERSLVLTHVLQRNNRPVTLEAIAGPAFATAGLSAPEIEQIALYQLATRGAYDAAEAAHEKALRLAAGGLLDVIEPDPAGLDGIGGLAGLKAWLTARRAAYEPAAAEFGLPQPKGVLLVGPPGTGKSLSARAVAANWGFPLARVDFGRLHGSYVGESEKNLRTVLGQLSGMAPVVAWIDEVEKGLAGSGSNGGEIARRMLQTLLTWMQESSGVFIFMTANDVTALPPELLRKGRLDEIFWLDLPDDAERQTIFRIHLAKRQRDPAGFPLPALAAATAGFSGAEIEAAVIDALHLAYAAGRDLQPADIVEAAAATRPLSKLSPEVVAAVRTWGATHARPAAQDPRRPAAAPVERLQA